MVHHWFNFILATSSIIASVALHKYNEDLDKHGLPITYPLEDTDYTQRGVLWTNIEISSAVVVLSVLVFSRFDYCSRTYKGGLNVARAIMRTGIIATSQFIIIRLVGQYTIEGVIGYMVIAFIRGLLLGGMEHQRSLALKLAVGELPSFSLSRARRALKKTKHLGEAVKEATRANTATTTTKAAVATNTVITADSTNPETFVIASDTNIDDDVMTEMIKQTEVQEEEEVASVQEQDTKRAPVDSVPTTTPESSPPEATATVAEVVLQVSAPVSHSHLELPSLRSEQQQQQLVTTPPGPSPAVFVVPAREKTKIIGELQQLESRTITQVDIALLLLFLELVISVYHAFATMPHGNDTKSIICLCAIGVAYICDLIICVDVHHGLKRNLTTRETIYSTSISLLVCSLVVASSLSPFL